MSDHWRVLVTGPVHGIEQWLDAARGAGWEGIGYPLIEVEPTGVDVFPSGARRPDWICVTSTNALGPLAGALSAHPELGEVPLACVGESTAQRAIELGFSDPLLPQPGAQNADGLAATLLEHAEPGQRVLWPRGDRARQFGARLEDAGLVVDSPAVYKTRARPLDGEPPSTDAVFFASPSAVEAWCALERSFTPAAIAIGWTTYEALAPVAEHFSVMLPLATPSVTAFRDCLLSFLPTD